MALFMGLSRTHIHIRNGERIWLNTDTWVDLTIHVYRGKSFMLPRDKVHPEPFSKIGHDGAGHGYLGTSTINVRKLLSCYPLTLQPFRLAGCIYILKMQIARSNSSLEIEEDLQVDTFMHELSLIFNRSCKLTCCIST